MQIIATTFFREVAGVPQQIVILLPLVCVRTHLPSSLLLEITPLEQVNSCAVVFTKLPLRVLIQEVKQYMRLCTQRPIKQTISLFYFRL